MEDLHKLSASVEVWANDPYWLTLLHAKKTVRGYTSHVDSEDFFLQGPGPFDPANELLATLRKFVEDNDTQCRFPVRVEWLESQLNTLGKVLPAVTCDEYETWRKGIEPKRIVMVFASSYLNSPSSMYGHTLLRIDPVSNVENNPLLSYAINFAAAVNPGENSLLYTFKGLTGGYPGYFSLVEYQKKIKDYSRIDNRDLWEYPLQLNEQEMRRVLAHIWELREIQFDYFFFKENCSYRLIELLEVARPGLSISHRFRGYAIPVDTVRILDEAGILGEASVRPSERKKLEQYAGLLTQDERQLALAIAREETGIEQLNGLDSQLQGRIAKLALDFWRYKNQKVPRKDKNIELSFELLRLINQYSEHLPKQNTSRFEAHQRPDQGHRSGRIMIGGGELSSADYLTLSTRFSYHDTLDLSWGYPDFMELVMGEAELRYSEKDHLELEKLKLVSISSLAPRDDLFKPLSWQVRIGAERSFAADRPLHSYLSGQFGHTYKLLPGTIAYGLTGLRLDFSNSRSQVLDGAINAELGSVLQFGRYNAAARFQLQKFGNDSEWMKSSLGLNYAIRTNVNVRLNGTYAKIDGFDSWDAKLTLGRYF